MIELANGNDVFITVQLTGGHYTKSGLTINDAELVEYESGVFFVRRKIGKNKSQICCYAASTADEILITVSAKHPK